MITDQALAQKIMVAVDVPSEQQALELVEQLAAFQPVWKIGMQLFYRLGPAFIEKMKQKNAKVFLDLKLHDIPNTVKSAAQSVASLGVDFLTIHCAGGQKMMEAALEGLALEQSSQTKVLGVTQLTSTSAAMLKEELLIEQSLEECILHYARLAQKSGLPGVVCSPLEVSMLKSALGSTFLTVTPGIRPSYTLNEDQVRVTTPKQAVQLGTDYLVIGRAITKAEDPAQAFQMILNEMRGA